MADQRPRTVRSELDGDVAVITLDRPERLNAWNAALAADLGAALQDADRDDAVRAIVLTGAGRAFCAGADLEAGGSTFDDRASEARRDGSDMPMVLPCELRKPVIAAINGAAIGVGITYPLLADVRVVAEDAKIAFAFVRRGMMPELGSHTLLARVVGFQHAADLLLSGRTISGTEAVDLGLAVAAVPAAEVLPVALERARAFAAAAPVSVAVTKRLLWEPVLAELRATMAREDPLFTWIGRQPDAGEGITSFLERRPPNWTMSPMTDMPSWPS
jgi:enoyl-CoA hydratase/carnithine racemase